MMKKILHSILFGSILALLSACNPNIIFEKYLPVDKQSWDKDSLLTFTVPISDTTANHNIFLNIRNDVTYNYSNLWLFIRIEQPDGKVLNDKFEITLADPSGKWLGKGHGGIINKETIYRKNIFFPVSGNYKFSIQQGMRKNKLDGINDVGIRIEKTE